MLDTGAITNDGRNLLAMATAGNPIVFTECLTDRYYKSASQIVPISTIQPGMGDLTGTIYNTTFDGVQSALITMRFKNTGSGSTFSGAWIKGKLASQSDSDAVLFCAVMDNDGFYIPNTSTVDSYVDIKVYITFTDVGSTINIVESGGCTIEQLNSAINSINNHSTDIVKTYRNFIDAQCYAKEGCGFNLDQYGIVWFKSKRPAWRGIGGTPSSYKVTDVCDQYVAVVAVYSSKTYLNIFDLTQATFNGEQIDLGDPVVYSQLGDESSSYGYVTIANVGGKHFAFAYTNASSTNLWWYNQDFGQSSDDKVVGRGAVMCIDTFTANNYTFNRGWWYQIETGTAIGARAIGGEFIIYTKDITTTDKIYIKQCTLNPSRSTMPLAGTSNQMSAPIDDCYIDRELSGRSYNYVASMFIVKKDDYYLAIGSFYHEGGSVFRGMGAAMVSGRTGDGTAITNKFERIYGGSIYDSLFYRACGFPYDFTSTTDISNFFNNHDDYNSPKLVKTYEGIIYTSPSMGESYYLASKASIVEGGYSGKIDPPWSIDTDYISITANGHRYSRVYDMSWCVLLADCGFIQMESTGSSDFIDGYDYVKGVGLLAGSAAIDGGDFCWFAYAPPVSGASYKVLGKI